MDTSTHLRLTGAAVLATLTSGCALLPLVGPTGWLAQAAGLVVVQAAVGALARRLRLARPLVVGVQLLVDLLLLTRIFAHGEALLGVLPGPAVYARFGLLAEQGVGDIARYTVPAPVTDHIRLLLVGGVVLVGLVVDALAVTYRSAASAGLPLLALYSVAAGLSQDHGDPRWFLCAAAGYLLLLLAEGRARLLAWGRVLTGPGDTPGTPRARRPAVTRTGRRVGAAALGIALLVPTALPSLGDGALEPPRRSGGGASHDGPPTLAINPLVALQDSLNQPENRIALAYRADSSAGRELYLRIVALDDFDGASWKPSPRRTRGVPHPLPRPPGLARTVRTHRVTLRVATADWYAQRWLPMPYPTERVRVAGRWRFEPEARVLVGDRGQTTRGLRYEVEGLVVEPTAEQLARAPRPPRRVLRRYTRVPASLPSVVRQTARRVTAGATTDYQRAVRLQDWFARDGGFTYDTEVRSGSGSAAIANFLRDREGFCVHFAFSMAAMARTLGIPARVAVGFAPGAVQPDGRVAVGLQDAHAWPELYFHGVGWTRFEPTPSRGTPPSYTLPDTPDDLPDPDGPRPDEDSASPEARPSPDCPGGGDGACAGNDPAVADGDGGSADGGVPWARVGGVAGAVLAAATVALLPLLWRVRVRARRLRGTTGSPPGDAGTVDVAGGGHRAATERARVLAAWAELTDSAWDFGIVPERGATPRATASRVVRLGRLRGAAADATHRLARAAEEALYAPRPRRDHGDLGEAVRQVRAGLRATAQRRERLRALLLPRSTARVGWALRNRWSALCGRVSGATRRAAVRTLPGRRGAGR